jgi:hypothetical protein
MGLLKRILVRFHEIVDNTLTLPCQGHRLVHTLGEAMNHVVSSSVPLLDRQDPGNYVRIKERNE